MNARRRRPLPATSARLRPNPTGSLWLRLLIATAGVGTATAIFMTWAVNYSAVPPPGKGATTPGGSAPHAPHKPVYAPLSAHPLSYLGVYGPGAPRSYGQVAEFTRRTQTPVNIALYYSGWGEPFKTAFAETARQRGAAVLVQIEPRKVGLGAIALGESDAYLRSYADEVRAFGHAVILSFGHEMNGPWYPWGRGHVPPAVFVAAWQHVVQVFRSEGADNVTWLWTVNTLNPRTANPRPWWPGGSYVTWVGINGYYFRPGDRFGTVFGATIRAVRQFTHDPILLPETAVGPLAGQVRGIRNLFAGIRRNKLLGLVWFDKAQHDGVYHQNWRLEDNPAALAAFRNAAGQMQTPQHGSSQRSTTP